MRGGRAGRLGIALPRAAGRAGRLGMALRVLALFGALLSVAPAHHKRLSTLSSHTAFEAPIE